MDKKQGKIDIIVGCMFSGKTTELIRRIRRINHINKNVMVINYHQDTRYGENKIFTHDREGIDSIQVMKLNEITENHYDKYKDVDVIGINEWQYFPDLFEFCKNACEKDHKTIIVSGLDGDYLRKPFGQILDLIPISNSVQRLNAFCQLCKDGTPAYFTRRIVNSNEKILIGGIDSYIPVCRYHYNQCIDESTSTRELSR